MAPFARTIYYSYVQFLYQAEVSAICESIFAMQELVKASTGGDREGLLRLFRRSIDYQVIANHHRLSRRLVQLLGEWRNPMLPGKRVNDVVEGDSDCFR